MDHIKVARVLETDFDEIVEAAGGHRYVPDAGAAKDLNADYVLGTAALELKLLEEEGLDGIARAGRREKIAELFRPTQPNLPVVVLDTELLDEDDKRTYYNLIGRSLQNVVKKAAAQLDKTKKALSLVGPRVLVALNNGFTGLTHDEFKRVLLKYAHNDTRKIDGLIVGGVYHYSDGFDAWILWPFEYVPINVSVNFSSFEALNSQWRSFSDRVMTSLVRGDDPARRFDKMPVLDLSFKVGPITYVAVSPKVGMESTFWGARRPRSNSTGITRCPPVGTIFPDLTRRNWESLRAAMTTSHFLKKAYEEWLKMREAAMAGGNATCPVVPIPVDASKILAAAAGVGPVTDADIYAHAVQRFEQQVREIIDRASDSSDCTVLPVSYIAVSTREVGRDKAFDTSSIHLIEGMLGTRKALLRDARIFHEHAIALGATYAVKHGIDYVIYARDRTYGWD